MSFDFHKFHALGNDYIVIDPREFPFVPDPDAVKAICDRSRGGGSDGILLGPLAGRDDLKGLSAPARFPETFSPWLRIFNPDGSEAEKSGNGLRIFSLYLAEAGYVGQEEFSIGTAGGRVSSRVLSLDPPSILIDMGMPSFSATQAGLGTDKSEFIMEPLDLGTETLKASFVSMGNPHCVIFADNPDPGMAKRLGPLVERHPLFPARTNVQFASVQNSHAMKIEIWERGAGYTLASGSSSCAAASVAARLGLVEGRVKVSMPGGTLDIDVAGASVRMSGPALRVFDGTFSPSMRAFLRGQTR